SGTGTSSRRRAVLEPAQTQLIPTSEVQPSATGWEPRATLAFSSLAQRSCSDVAVCRVVPAPVIPPKPHLPRTPRTAKRSGVPCRHSAKRIKHNTPLRPGSENWNSAQVHGVWGKVRFSFLGVFGDDVPHVGGFAAVRVIPKEINKSLCPAAP